MAPQDQALCVEAFIKLIRASSSVMTRVHRPLGSEPLTESQFGVLEALYHLGPLCRRDLAEKVLQTGGNVTMIVDNLEKKGWVERERSHVDRRIVAIQLTREGRAMMDRVFPRIAASIAEEMSVLSREELMTLARLCRKLGLREQPP